MNDTEKIPGQVVEYGGYVVEDTGIPAPEDVDFSR